MSVLDTILFAAAILVIQVLLAAGLGTGFMWLRIIERDTRLPEEEGRKTILEVTGGGSIGRSGWSMRPLCRLTLYDIFLVASIKSTRVLLRYDKISSVSVDAEKKNVRIQGPEENGVHKPDILFAVKNPDELAAEVQKMLPQMKG